VRTITLFDTSVSTDNLGDEIIIDAVDDVIREVFPDAYVFRVPSHDRIGEQSRSLIAKSDLSIVGGTNLLQPNMLARKALWKLGLADVLKLKSVVLLGVGWRDYTHPMRPQTRMLLDRILHRGFVHSVRDGYTAEKLKGVQARVSNTGCMTMWRLDPERCARIPRRRAPAVVTTLTYYRGNPTADRRMLELLKAKYGSVAFWPQQRDDLDYMRSLGVEGIELIMPRTDAFNAALDQDVDFVGTRLHGGVRALQKGRRALIVTIDNRATEIARDTNLPTVLRGDDDAIARWIDGDTPTEIRLPTEAITAWKAQFRG
jgi:polysaccharide pyruvyl transferase WcaK-like protein